MFSGFKMVKVVKYVEDFGEGRRGRRFGVAPVRCPITLMAFADDSSDQCASGSADTPAEGNDSNSSSLSQDREKATTTLSQAQAQIVARQVDIPVPNVGYTTLFRYATRNDWLFMGLGTVAAIVAGAMEPLSVLVFGNLSSTFGTFLDDRTEPPRPTCAFVFSYIATTTFIYTGDHIATQFRVQFLASTLRQNIALFDTLSAGELTSRITTDTNLIQERISEKVGVTLIAASSFIAAFVIGFVKSWKLTLILSSTVVAFVLTLGILSRFIVKYHVEALARYSKASTVVEECVGGIRTILAFGAQDRLTRQYDEQLARAESWGFKAKASTSLFNAFIMCYVYLTYSLAFWQGSRYLVQGLLDFGSILIVVMSITLGAFAICNITPNHQAFMAAIAAAHKVCALIDRASPIDPFANSGHPVDDVVGEIIFEGVSHVYPQRPEIPVLRDFSLRIPAGKTTALVGASGSGKSTVIGLIERFFEPVAESIALDGQDIRGLNLRGLRRQISLVGQEPVLFATTIFENIRYGLIGTEYESAPRAQILGLIESAATLANAHGFITALPEGYETHVGERGFLLSGGQKQRIAIARAMVSNPRILLLDEATSALDPGSEGIVQAALDQSAAGRTTIIVVVSEGRVVEQGTHAELMGQVGAYAALVETQAGVRAGAGAQEEGKQPQGRPDDEEAEEEEACHLAAKAQGEITPSLTSNVIAEKQQAGKKELDRESGPGTTGLSTVPTTAPEVVSAGAWATMQLILRLNRREWPWMVVGLGGVLVTGGANPTSSVFLAKSVANLALPLSQSHTIRQEINFWSWMYFMLAILVWLGFVVQGTAFAYCAEKLIRNARRHAFRCILRQDVAFFDEEANSSGALTSFLATETSNLKGMSGATLGTILSGIITLVAACAVALAIGWKLALVCMATIPFLIAGGLARHLREIRSFACEATAAIRTVASLTREAAVLAEYRRQLTAQSRRALRSTLRSSILFALSQAFIIASMALGFWYGGTLIAAGEYDLFRFLLCFGSVIFGAQTTGYVFTFADDIGKAQHAAGSLRTLFRRVPAVDTWSTDGRTGPEGAATTSMGALEFRGVRFTYSTRREHGPVMKALDLTVAAGQTVALVGASGCGKSTVLALLERFYEPDGGAIYLDGTDITTINVNRYRSRIALVSQEPTLFEGTIRDNILLGVEGPEEVEEKVLVQACRDANIYNFITSLPDGFETVVGAKGGNFSGGQKQRLAIARALVRNPTILLLDEATSALNTASEQIVQRALDQAATGRTTVVVAHRLSTVRNADCIFVLDAGEVVEAGSHAELLARGGRYAELVRLQALATDAS
ncbi:ABC transporter ATP-binding protein [Aspergillus brunneoviolaceus CBS 621.78]|uniref:ABC transporter n=1 Tax=Aspergillus brunneoviolaceus CBS 621.78 TaxID=1450534 RepID=A0ACD1GA90_9EURO|nr:ABC transporter [Aspergillus brunneoviolaceus CBS 621.78]RAH46196.1 ABC transporter [Aspergillus brunneoviolaceus CBS 621.78]